MSKVIWIVNEYNPPETLRTRQTILAQHLEEKGYKVYLICGSIIHKTGRNILSKNEKIRKIKYDGAKYIVVIKYFKEEGLFAEVVSDDEYLLAKSIGVKDIIYNGIAKSKETFIEAVESRAIVNIDSEYEIKWLDDLTSNNCEVGIRVNFDLEDRCPGQTQCGKDGERFGFCYENGELGKAIDRIRSKGIKVAGLHLHKSSKTRMPEVYRAIAEIAVEVARDYNLILKYIDIGGGFFGELEGKPKFPEYFNMVADILAERFSPKDTKLVIEPGMALVGGCIDYITTVKDIKKTTRNTFVVTDGSRTQIDPLMSKSEYFFDIEKNNEQQRSITSSQVVSGFTCMEHDRLFEIENMESLLPGDRIVYHKVGAYTMCLSPLFIKWYPDVYLRDGKEIEKIRSKWQVEDFIGRGD